MANRLIHTPSYLATADLAKYWTNVTAQFVVSAGWYAKSGGAVAQAYMYLDAQTGWTIGFRFVDGSGIDNRTIIAFRDAGTIQTDLRFNGATGHFYVTRNGTTLATGTAVVGVNEEVYVEFQSTFQDSGGICKVYLNGNATPDIDYTGDTKYTANTTADQVGVSAGNAGWKLKDFYLNDDSGGVDDGPWGPIVVDTVVVTGAGNSAGWTPSTGSNWQNVDDATPDDDSTHNSSTASGVTDTFATGGTAYSTGTVLGVEWVGDLKTDIAGTGRTAPVYRIGSTDYVRSDLQPGTSYLLMNERDRQSPATSSAWTLSEIGAMEIGYKRTVT